MMTMMTTTYDTCSHYRVGDLRDIIPETLIADNDTVLSFGEIIDTLISCKAYVNLKRFTTGYHRRTVDNIKRLKSENDKLKGDLIVKNADLIRSNKNADMCYAENVEMKGRLDKYGFVTAYLSIKTVDPGRHSDYTKTDLEDAFARHLNSAYIIRGIETRMEEKRGGILNANNKRETCKTVMLKSKYSNDVDRLESELAELKLQHDEESNTLVEIDKRMDILFEKRRRILEIKNAIDTGAD